MDLSSHAICWGKPPKENHQIKGHAELAKPGNASRLSNRDALVTRLGKNSGSSKKCRMAHYNACSKAHQPLCQRQYSAINCSSSTIWGEMCKSALPKSDKLLRPFHDADIPTLLLRDCLLVKGYFIHLENQNIYENCCA